MSNDQEKRVEAAITAITAERDKLKSMIAEPGMDDDDKLNIGQVVDDLAVAIDSMELAIE